MLLTTTLLNKQFAKATRKYIKFSYFRNDFYNICKSNKLLKQPNATNILISNNGLLNHEFLNIQRFLSTFDVKLRKIPLRYLTTISLQKNNNDKKQLNKVTNDIIKHKKLSPFYGELFFFTSNSMHGRKFLYDLSLYLFYLNIQKNTLKQKKISKLEDNISIITPISELISIFKETYPIEINHNILPWHLISKNAIDLNNIVNNDKKNEIIASKVINDLPTSEVFSYFKNSNLIFNGVLKTSFDNNTNITISIKNNNFYLYDDLKNLSFIQLKNKLDWEYMMVIESFNFCSSPLNKSFLFYL